MNPRRSTGVVVSAVALSLLAAAFFATPFFTSPAGAAKRTTKASGPTAPTAVPPPRIPPRTETLTDPAGLVGNRNETELRGVLEKGRARAGAEIAVLVVDSLERWNAAGMGAARYAARVLQEWNIGDPIRNDGAVVLIVSSTDEAVIAAGPGYRSRPDAELAVLAATVLQPAVARSEYTAGLRETIPELARVLSLTSTAALDTTPLAVETTAAATTERSLPVPLPALLGVGAGVLGVVGAVIAVRRRKQPPICPQCGSPHRRMTRAQRRDRRSGTSTDEVAVEGGVPLPTFLAEAGLRLWGCELCGHVLVDAGPADARCTSCSHRAFTTLNDRRGATSDEPGIVAVTTTCRSCRAKRVASLGLPAVRNGGRVPVPHVR